MKELRLFKDAFRDTGWELAWALEGILSLAELYRVEIDAANRAHAIAELAWESGLWCPPAPTEEQIQAKIAQIEAEANAEFARAMGWPETDEPEVCW